MSTDPALGEYIPEAGKGNAKDSGNLPGMCKVFNVVNFNLYHYGANDPVNFRDPWGLDTVDVSFAFKSSLIGQNVGFTGFNIQLETKATLQKASYPTISSGGYSSNTDKNTSETIHTMLDIAGCIPAVGNVADALNAVYYLAEGDIKNTVFAAVSFLPLGDMLAKGAKYVSKALPEIANFLSKYSDKLADTANLISKNGEDTSSAAKAVTGSVKTDFYVSPSSNVIPATGYRYVSENAPYLDNMTKSMTIPANANGTYFSFNNYDIANPSALQVPHDASIKVSFDTLQIIDDISIPYGKWGKAPYLEPITKDFPQFGLGGATQVITHSEINIMNIDKLNKY